MNFIQVWYIPPQIKIFFIKVYNREHKHTDNNDDQDNDDAGNDAPHLEKQTIVSQSVNSVNKQSNVTTKPFQHDRHLM